MNRTIAFLILGVVVLALVLIMASQYRVEELGNTQDVLGDSTAQTAAPPRPPAEAAAEQQAPAPPAPRTSPQIVSTPTPAQALTPPAPAAPAQRPPVQLPRVQPDRADSTSPAPAAPGASAPVAPSSPEESRAPRSLAEPQAASAAQGRVSAPPAVDPPQVAPRPAAQATSKPRTIRKITVRRHKDGTNVRINLSQAAKYRDSRLPDPDRLVIDLEGIWEVKAPGVPDNRFVSNVRVGKYDKVTRIVLDLKGNPASIKFYKMDGDDLEVRLR